MHSNQTRLTSLAAGHNIAYYRKGAGETVLLVHGISTHSFIWRYVFDELSSSHDVIAVDLLGCGYSDKPLTTSYSLTNQCSILNEFLDQLNIEKIHMVGHDVGGGIAQIFAVNHADRLLDITLINSVGYDFWPVQPVVAMRTPIIRQLAMATLDFGALKLIVKRGVYYKEKVTDELMDFFWKPLQTKEGRKALLHFARCLDNRNLLDIADQLKSLKMPVLILRGDADVYLNKAICLKLHQEIPNSKLVCIDTAGHLLTEDEPEFVMQNLRAFLSKEVN